jgi:hypothetical protein
VKLMQTQPMRRAAAIPTLIQAINQVEAAAMPVPRMLIQAIPWGRGAGRRRLSSELGFRRKRRKAQPGFRF